MKKIIITVVILVIFCVSFYSFFTSSILKEKLANFIVQKISTKDKEISFKSIEINLPNQIIIKDFNIKHNEKLLLEAKKIILFFNLKDLFLRQNYISKIKFIDPNLFLSRTKNGNWDLPKFTTKVKEKKNTIAIFIQNGQIYLDDKYKEIKSSLQNIFGYFKIKENGTSQINLFASSSKENVNIFGDFNFKNLWYDLTLKTENFNLKDFSNYINIKDYKFKGGKISGEFKFKNYNFKTRNVLRNIEYVCKGNILECKIQPLQIKLPITTITGDFYVTKDLIKTKQLFFQIENSEIIISGNYKKENADFTLTSSKFNLNTLGFSNVAKNFVPSGYAKFKILCLGKLNNLKIAGNISLEKGEIANLPVDNLIMQFNYLDKNLVINEFKTNLSRGKLIGNGKILLTENPKYDINLKLENLDLKTSFVNYNISNISGKINLTSKINGTLNKMYFENLIKVENLNINNCQFPILNGFVVYNNYNLRTIFKTNDDNMNFDLNLYNFYLTKKEKNNFCEIKSSLDIKEMLLQDFIKIFALKLKKQRGNVKTRIEISGKFNKPQLRGLVFVSNNEFLKGGFSLQGEILDKKTKVNIETTNAFIHNEIPINLSTEILITKKNFEINYLNLNNNFVGKLKISDNKYLAGKLMLKSKTEDLLNILGPKFVNFSKRVNFVSISKSDAQGELNFSGTINAPVLLLDIKISDAPLVYFKCEYKNKVFNLSVIIEQQEGKFISILKIHNIIEGEIIVQNFIFGNQTIDTHLYFTINKKDGIDGKIYGEKLLVNKTFFTPLEGTFFYNNKELTYKFNLNKNYILNGKINFLQKPITESIIIIKNEKSSFLMSLFHINLKENFGLLNGEIKITGNLFEPLIDGNIKLQSQKWYDFANIKFCNASKNKILLKEIFLIKNDGIGILNGEIILGDKIKISLNTKLNEYPVYENLVTTTGKIEANFNKKEASHQIFYFSEKLELSKLSSLIRFEKCKLSFAIRDEKVNFIFNNDYSYAYLKGIEFVTKEVLLSSSLDKNKEIITKAVINDLLVNDQKFGMTKFVNKYKDNTITFYPVEQNIGESQITGSLKINNHKKFTSVIFNNLNFQKENITLLSLNGYFSKKEYSNLKITVNNINSNIFSGYLNSRYIISGLASFNITLLGYYPNISGETFLKIENGEICKVKFDVLKGNIILKNGVFTLNNFRVIKTNKYIIKLSGIIPLSFSNQEVDITAFVDNGTMDVFGLMFNQIESTEGIGNAIIHIKGPWNDINLSGKLNISNGIINSKIYAKKFTNIYTSIIVERNKVYINKLEGNIGEGKIWVLRNKDNNPNIILKGLSIDAINISLLTDNRYGIKLNIPGFIKQYKGFLILKSGYDTGNFILYGGKKNEPFTICGSKNSILVKGTIELNNVNFTYPPEKEKKSSQKQNGFLDRCDFDIKLIGKKCVWYRITKGLFSLNTEVKGGIDIIEKQGDVKIGGEIETEKGWSECFNHSFKITEGKIKFLYVGGKIIPIINICAETYLKEEEYEGTIYLIIKELELEKIQLATEKLETGKTYIELKSDPPLDTRDSDKNKIMILSLLTSGRILWVDKWVDAEFDEKLQEIENKTKDTLAIVSKRLLDEKLTVVFETGIKELVKLDFFKIKSGIVTNIIRKNEVPLLKDTEVITGKYIGNWYLKYKAKLIEKEIIEKLGLEQEIELEYPLTRKLLLKGVLTTTLGEEEKIYGLGFAYRERF